MRSRAARWSLYVVVAILFAVACAFLSNWQFARNEQRAAGNALIEQNYDADAVPIGEVLSGTDDFDAQDEWQPVVLTGTYLTEDQLLVRNRAQGGTSAFEVLVPFRLDDGRIIVVDRGWVQPGEGDAPDAVPSAPEGDVTVLARLRPGEQLPASGRSAPEGQLPTIHLPSVAALTGGDTITAAYGLMVSEDPAPAERPQPLAAPEVEPGPHLSYAIQWILFAVMGFIFIGYMIRTEITARREEAEPDDEDDDDDELEDAPRRRTPPVTRRPRRRDRDADEEDALIDAGGR
ncbi:SURF1 family protein [Microbacterium betulae]|uniref:SURF1-like protein n=1 Tax=Microbacterium betulae TaxID=2981139 RepID=A0AA97FKN5_9MICO|nr:SURF1 family protein [Microbacterium sp. AB]WOF24748.1 SURF1 family protein [Microbacterium sp. AB]